MPSSYDERREDVINFRPGRGGGDYWREAEREHIESPPGLAESKPIMPMRGYVIAGPGPHETPSPTVSGIPVHPPPPPPPSEVDSIIQQHLQAFSEAIESELNKLRTNLDIISRRITKLSEDLEQVKRQVETASAYQQDLPRIAQSIISATIDATIRSRLDKAVSYIRKKAVKEIKAAVQKLRDETSEIIQRMKREVGSELDAIKQRLSDISDVLARLSATDIGRMATTVSELRAAVDDIRNRVGLLERMFSERVSELEEKYKSLSSTVAELSGRVSALEQKVEVILRLVDGISKSIGVVSSKLDQIGEKLGISPET